MQGLLQKRPAHNAQDIGLTRFLYNYNAIFRIIKLKNKRFRFGDRMTPDYADRCPFSQKQSGNRATDAAGTTDNNSFFTMKNFFHLQMIPQEY